MGQNTSSAVMQQRSKELDSLDDFPTPPWGTRALLTFLADHQLIGPGMSVREPAANRGHMASVLGEAFKRVEASDICDYGAGYPVADFLFPIPVEPVDWTITNPPFRLAEQFISRAMETSHKGVAMLVRSAFTEGAERHEQIFARNAPHLILQFTERLVMHQGKLVNPNVAVEVTNPETGKTQKRKPSSATAYCWSIWRKDVPPVTWSRFHWTGRCRARLERDEDYGALINAGAQCPA